MKGGDPFAQKIRQSLLSSRELCVLYTPNAKDSVWVSTEWGAAWALGMRITPILSGIAIDAISDDRLKQLQTIDMDELDEFVAAVQKRREKTTAL
ncbi:MAG: toll/interleukin-1 receptor domain-containing protein [Planctomycetes bacterium]|nr:toll/interleukin-1 receptor domain-containing protein [Planctomycetota bacterium]